MAGRPRKQPAEAAPPRRRQFSREERQGELLDAAFELFSTQGYSDTRIEDVALRAGVAKGLVPFYFKNKEELFRAGVERVIPPLLEELDVLTSEPHDSAAEVLREAMQVIYRCLVEEPRAWAVLQLLTAEGDRFPELKAFYYATVVARSDKALRRIVDLGFERGEFAFEAREALPRVLLGPAIMAVFWQILFNPLKPLDCKRLFEAHMELTLRGLEPR